MQNHILDCCKGFLKSIFIFCWASAIYIIIIYINVYVYFILLSMFCLFHSFVHVHLHEVELFLWISCLPHGHLLLVLHIHLTHDHIPVSPNIHYNCNIQHKEHLESASFALCFKRARRNENDSYLFKILLMFKILLICANDLYPIILSRLINNPSECFCLCFT